MTVGAEGRKPVRVRKRSDHWARKSADRPNRSSDKRTNRTGAGDTPDRSLGHTDRWLLSWHLPQSFTTRK